MYEYKKKISYAEMSKKKKTDCSKTKKNKKKHTSLCLLKKNKTLEIHDRKIHTKTAYKNNIDTSRRAKHYCNN